MLIFPSNSKTITSTRLLDVIEHTYRVIVYRQIKTKKKKNKWLSYLHHTTGQQQFIHLLESQVSGLTEKCTRNSDIGGVPRIRDEAIIGSHIQADNFARNVPVELVHIAKLSMEMHEERIAKCTREMVLRLNDQKIAVTDPNRKDVQNEHVFGLEAEQCLEN